MWGPMKFPLSGRINLNVRRILLIYVAYYRLLLLFFAVTGAIVYFVLTDSLWMGPPLALLGPHIR